MSDPGGKGVSDLQIRRVAARRGYRVWKSRQRDPHAEHFGMWWLVRRSDGIMLGPLTRPELVAFMNDPAALTRELDIAAAPDE